MSTEHVELGPWVLRNLPKPSMYWKDSALAQFQQMDAIGQETGLSASVVETHTSKSIELPVVRFEGSNGYFLVRHNFYDWNLAVVWNGPVALTCEQAGFAHLTWDWYLGEINKKRNYSFKGWTEEEVADPRILRVLIQHEKGHTYWSKASAEEKDAWAERMNSTEWYTSHWSSGLLLPDGEMPGCGFWRGFHAFAEGIERYYYESPEYTSRRRPLRDWQPGLEEGLFCVGSSDEVARIINLINNG